MSRLVAQCLGYLNRPHILKEEGLFRISGDVAQINELKAKFIAGKIKNNSTTYFLLTFSLEVMTSI